MVVSGLPTGTVTLLFTDIAGSTTLLEERGDDYPALLAEHRRLLRAAFSRHGGVEVDTQGDAFFAVFEGAGHALDAARDVQQALEGTPVRVRIGLHTCEPLLTDEGYVGVDVHRAARIAASGHGGQVLLSQTTRDLVHTRIEMRDLGEHRLKDLSAPQRLYQIGHQDFPPLLTLYQANLPLQRTPLVGRKRELGEVSGLLKRYRLITLVGPGGSGKTRLALQVAAEAVEGFEDGVWWVSLAPLADADLVEAAIVQAVGAKGKLGEHLRSRRALLLLDNFEHLLAAAARVAELLQEAPRIAVLATSREPLHLTGEQRYPVPPLSENEAVALFSERARAVRPSFQPDAHVVAICRQLDGLPLALELAAARVSLLPPARLADRLERSLALLTGGTRDAPQRQRTLRATLEWSYELLDDQEARLFARLAVFAGSFSLEAAEEVCEATLDLLQGLVEKNLVRDSDGARFFYLETVREFALERLNEIGEFDAARRRHAEFFLGVAENWEPHLNQVDVLRAAEEDEGNLRAALGYAHERAPELMLQLAGSLWRFWFYRGRYEEGRRWLSQALTADGGRSLARADALRGLSAVLTSPSDAEYARSLTEEAIEIHREHGDEIGLARCLNNLGTMLSSGEEADLDTATQLLRECLAIGKRARDGEAFSLAFPLGNLADISLRRGDLVEARRLSDEELEIAQFEQDDVNIADANGRLAWVEALEGNYDEAALLLSAPLQFGSQIGSRWPGSTLALAAVIAAHRGKRTDAAKLFGAIHAHRARLDMAWPDSPATHAIAATDQKLVEEGLGAARAAGQALSFDELRDVAFRAIA